MTSFLLVPVVGGFFWMFMLWIVMELWPYSVCCCKETFNCLCLNKKKIYYTGEPCKCCLYSTVTVLKMITFLGLYLLHRFVFFPTVWWFDNLTTLLLKNAARKWRLVVLGMVENSSGSWRSEGWIANEISLRGTGMMEFGRGGFFFEDVEEGSKIILVVSSWLEKYSKPQFTTWMSDLSEGGWELTKSRKMAAIKLFAQ